jgi:glycosyltransferase involved in cell wall biosynthesis
MVVVKAKHDQPQFDYLVGDIFLNVIATCRRIFFSQQAALALIASFAAAVPFGQLSQVPMALMAVCGLVLMKKQGRALWDRPEIRLYFLLFLFFWVPIGISLIGAVNPVKTLTVWILFLRFFPAGVFIIFALTKPGAPAKLLRLTAWVLLLWMFDALLQAGLGKNLLGKPLQGQVTSFFRAGSDLGMVLSVFCPLLLVHIRRNWPLFLQVVAVNLLVAVVFLAGGRGGWICLAVVMAGFWTWLVYRDRKTLFLSAAVFLLMVLTLVATWHASDYVSERVKQSVMVFSGDTESIDTALGMRLGIWQTAVDIFRDNPLNGVGARNLRYVYADYASSDDWFVKRGMTVYHAHALVLDVGSETGIVGLGGLVLALGLLLRTWLGADLSRRKEMLPYALALSAAFFPFNTHYATYSSAWSAACFWLLALFCATTGKGAVQSVKPWEKTVLWWGRFDQDYSRNRLIRRLLVELGWRVQDFRPLVSPLGNLQATLTCVSKPDFVWVPSFRHRDLLSARRWSHRHKIPLLFDPLISDYDKQVFERRKFAENSHQANRLLAKESRLLQASDLVLADTFEHARFFKEVLKADPRRICVLPVGAEEDLFYPDKNESAQSPGWNNAPPEILFYGSFIPLQGPQFIADAVRQYQGPAVNWVFLGDGPLLEKCQKITAGLPNVSFENWLPYLQLPSRIRRADILLGIFGDTPKTGRVIPNKVFQSMACGRPVITAATPAYPRSLLENSGSGIIWVDPANPKQLADAAALLAGSHEERQKKGVQAYQSFNRYFSLSRLRAELEKILAQLPFENMQKKINHKGKNP